MAAFVAAAFLLIVDILIGDSEGVPPFEAWLVASFVLGMFLCWIGIVIDGVATIIGAFFVFILRTFVDAGRWIMWRISNYPKGPLTATLTLIGAILAVARILTTR